MSLRTVFSGVRRYSVPIFQRSYSWTSHEVALLLSDLWFGLEEQREQGAHFGGCFLGSLVVVEGPGAAAGDVDMLVIDGKQRLTSLTMLLFALRDRLGDQAPRLAELLTAGAHRPRPSAVRPTGGLDRRAGRAGQTAAW